MNLCPFIRFSPSATCRGHLAGLRRRGSLRPRQPYRPDHPDQAGQPEGHRHLQPPQVGLVPGQALG
jgi:hypothetical protein